MKKHLSQFFMRGMFAAVFGPVVLAVIYGILGASGKVTALPPGEVCRGILSITLMAFIAGGVTMVYQIERLPLFSAVLMHGGVLYCDYLIMYLFNNWLPRNAAGIGAFTLIFIAGYAVIWMGIYLHIRKKAAEVNQKLPGNKRA